VPSNFSSLTVTWYDESDAYATTADITADIKTIPLFTDTGTGEVNSAQIVVRSLNGKYNTTAGTKFAEYDRIRLQVTDLDSNAYDKYFEIMNIIPSQTKVEGTLLTLECLGIEYHTQQISMSKPLYFENSFNAAIAIGFLYEHNRGTEQPKLSNYTVPYDIASSGYGNGLPFWNANNWEFGISEDSCYNRWMDLLEGAGASVSEGGALTFYELNFLTSGVNALNFKMRASGDNTSFVTLDTALAVGSNHVDIGEQEGMISNPTGSNLLAWGSNEHGSLPVENSRYWSGVQKFIFRPEWETGQEYAVDADIKVTDTSTEAHAKHYTCILAHTSASGNKPETGTWATYWSQIDQGDEFGDSIQYSPWTEEKARVWTNSGADPARVNFSQGAWFDINVVINEKEFFRTWVDAVVTTTNTDTDLNTLAARYAYNGTKETFPRGFRVAVIATGTLTGDLANFQDQVVQIAPKNNLGNYEWQSLYTFDTGNSKVQIANLDTAVIHIDTITAGPTHTWSTIETDAYGNDCFHPYTSAPTNVVGADLVFDKAAVAYVPRSDITDSTDRPDITKAGGVFSKNQNTAIKFVTASTDIQSSVVGGFTGQGAQWYKYASGFTWRVPYPTTVDGGINEQVGELYGGGATNTIDGVADIGPNWVTAKDYVKGNIVFNSDSRYICLIDNTAGTFATDLAALKWRSLPADEPATLDIQNMNYTHDGQDGFNTINSSSEDYGQISALAMWLNFKDTAGDNEHRFRAWMIDTKDNVVYQDFVVTTDDNWEDIRLPIGSFRPYRGRKPLYAIDVGATLIPPKDLEIINIFEWRNIKLVGVQWQPPYDKFGRFNPVAAAVDEAGNSVTWGTFTGSTKTLQVDGIHFVKPLLATSGPVTDRNLEPDFLQLPNITVYDQLVNAAKSQLEIEKFRHQEYNIETAGDAVFDILFGESFLFENSDLVYVASPDGDETTNKIKLVAKRIEYSITKPVGGKGGLRRKINGSKVFT
jgi:hypothetical protein